MRSANSTKAPDSIRSARSGGTSEIATPTGTSRFWLELVADWWLVGWGVSSEHGSTAMCLRSGESG